MENVSAIRRSQISNNSNLLNKLLQDIQKYLRPSSKPREELAGSETGKSSLRFVVRQDRG